MYRSAWAKVLLLSATPLLFPMESLARSDNAYGVNAPFGINDLPPGILKKQLEDLSPAAQKRALGWMHRFSFTEQDVPALRVDQSGGVFYEDPAFDGIDPAPSSTPSLSEVTQAEAFTLHSKPGASRVVYLDMDGHVVSGTIWNGSADPLYMRPYDSNGDESSFSQTELNEIAETWKRVAEDFAPYDIDVTTEEPPTFGANVGHILVTRKADENNRNIYNCNCGGVAYVGVWGNSNFPYYQPALVFLDGVGGPHNISEAASHELGHNLSLSHDGNSSTGYYGGHGSGNTDWGPIMGVGYYAQVSQWSKGEYADANNTQDDLQLIADRLTYRSDDHEDVNFSGATPLVITGGTSVSATNPVTDPANIDPSNKGIIEDRTDVDLFFMDVGDGTINLSVTPAWTDSFASQSRRGMNLDVKAVLYDEFGYEVAQSNPLSDTYATINVGVAAGRYILSIEGVGVGDPLTNGYTDYGSLGQYFITGSVPEDSVSTSPPPAPTDLSAVQSGDANIALSWTDPLSTAENNEAGYRVYRQIDGGSFVQISTLPRDSASFADNNLASGTYVYQLEAYNSAGISTSNSTILITISVPSTASATSENIAMGSIVSGSYQSTVNVSGYERISEQHQGGKPQNRVSQMEHYWTVSGIAPAASVTLDVDVTAPSNSDGDDFALAYSTDGSNYQPFGMLSNGTGRQVISALLPAGTSGSISIRVNDTDRTAGNGQNNYLDVYQIVVTSAGEPGDLPPTVTISEPADNTTAYAGDWLIFSATASDSEDGDLSSDLSWSSSLDGNLGQGASVQTSTLSLGTHVITATVTDSADNSDSDTVNVTISDPVQNNAPVANTDNASVDQDSSVVINVLSNDTDADGDSLTIGSVTPGANGSVTNNGSTVTYTPNASFAGNDSFSYNVNDGQGGSDTGTVNVTVNPTGGAVLTVTDVTPNTIGVNQQVAVTLVGTGFTQGASVSFQNGSGPAPSASGVVVVNSTTITANVFVKAGGPRRNRTWDVVVNNGSSATCSGCITVTP